MTLYSVHCSLCKIDYSSKSEWNNHLTQEEHQNLAKQKCWSNSERDKCLVIYSSFEVTVTSGGAQKIIQYFSTNLWNWVTDFVNWEERPYLAIVQFESREKAEQIISGITEPNLRIDGQRVKIKLVSDLDDLEWNSHLPRHSTQKSDNLVQSKRKRTPSAESFQESATKRPNNDNAIVVPLVSKKLKGVVQHLNLYAKRCGWKLPKYNYTEYCNSDNESRWSCSVVLNKVEYSPTDGMPTIKKKDAQRQAAYYCQEVLLNPAYQSVKPSDQKINTASSLDLDGAFFPINSLQDQFRKVCKAVTIPEDKYNTFLEVGRSLQTMFRKVDPKIKVVLFRNFHLKLTDPKLTAGTPLLFYGYRTGSKIFFLKETEVMNVLEANRALTVMPAQNLGPKVKYRCKGVYFTFVTKPHCFVEVQMCRLLEYLFTFDNRCQSLIAVCWFWCTINEVKICGNSGLGITSDLITMEWLVIHYLCHEGILPTVREIQQRKHKELTYRGVDISFSADPEFAKEWKSGRKEHEVSQCSEEFVLGVLELFQGFLKFYGERLAKNKWILNTRDGEVINMENFLTTACGRLWTTKMTSEDLSALRKIQKEGEYNDQFKNGMGNGIPNVYKVVESERIDFRQFHLYMAHPLIYTWRFSLNKNKHHFLDKMKLTAQQLDMFFEMRKCEGVGKAGKCPTENLSNVLTLNKS